MKVSCSSPTACRSRSRSRATSAVAMWAMIREPRCAQASARNRSPAAHAASSSGVTGNAKGVKNGNHCREVPKQRSAVLRAIPRGSKRPGRTAHRARSRRESVRQTARNRCRICRGRRG